MGKLTLLGSAGSTCSRRVLTVLYEKNAQFELKTVNMAEGEHKKEPFISKQPFGQIPVLEDGDFTLYESRAICR